MNLSEVFPIKGIENKAIVNVYGDITFGFVLLQPEVYRITTERYNEMNNEVIQFLRTLSVGSVAHKQDFIYRDQYHAKMSDKMNYSAFKTQQYYHLREIVKSYSHLYVTFSARTQVKIDGAKTTLLTKVKGKDKDKLLDKVGTYYNTLLSGLKNLSFVRCVPMEDAELANNVFNYFGQTYDNPESAGLVPPISWDDKNGLIKIGNDFINVFSMVKEPDTLYASRKAKLNADDGSGVGFDSSIDMPYSMMFPIGLGLPINHVVNTIVEVLDTESVLSNFSGDKRWFPLIGLLAPEITSAKGKDITNYTDVITNDGLVPTRTSVNVITKAKDLQTLEIYENLVRTAFSEIEGAKIWAENEDSLNLYLATVPGNTKNYYRSMIHADDLSSTFFSWESQYKSDKKGYVYSDRAGNPVVLEFGKDLPAKHGLIFGETGSGKSVWLNNLIDQSLNQGHNLTVIEIGGSMKKQCLLYDGFYFDTSDQSLLKFAPFLLCPKRANGSFDYLREDGDGEGSGDFISFIYSLIASIWKDNEIVTPGQKAIVINSIMAYYEHLNKVNENHADFKGWWDYTKVYEKEIDPKEAELLNWNDLRVSTQKFADGIYREVLNGKEIKDMTGNQLTVFDLAGVEENKDLFQIICIVIMQMATQKMESLPLTSVKYFLVDEALDFLKGDMGDYLGAGYRKWRKRNGRIFLATQDSSFIDGVDKLVKDSIFRNATIRVMLRGKTIRESVINDAKRLLDLNDADIELYRSTVKYEFLMKMGEESIVLKSEQNPHSLALYTTDPNEVEVMERLYHKNGDMVMAINEFLTNKN